MSIFPKRSVPGETVTIHWNYNTSKLTDFHVLPWVRIGVRSPQGKITMLFEQHVLALPDKVKDLKTEEPALKYLSKSVPLLLLADYLNGKHKKEKLIEILENIQSGRHYYFTYQLPEDAPLGKYHLISEIHINGEVKFSKTAADDFFFVEKVSCKASEKLSDEKQALVFNHSPEKTPVKIVGCIPTMEGKMRTTVNVFEIDAHEERRIPLTTPLSFLLYNEERQVVPLQASSSAEFLLRNQQVSTLNKEKGNTYLFKKDKDEAYKLNEKQKTLWEKADGLLKLESLSKEERALLEEMRAEGLIQSVSFKE